MAWAAAFLYEATQDEDYLTAAESWYEQGGLNSAWSFSWDSKAPGVQLLLLKLTKDEGKRAMYKKDAENFVGGAIEKGSFLSLPPSLPPSFPSFLPFSLTIVSSSSSPSN